MEVELVDYLSSDEKEVILGRLPGKLKSPTVTLSGPMTRDLTLWSWHEAVRQGNDRCGASERLAHRLRHPGHSCGQVLPGGRLALEARRLRDSEQDWRDADPDGDLRLRVHTAGRSVIATSRDPAPADGVGAGSGPARASPQAE